MTKEEKKEYNKKYYQENKDYWVEYYGREGVAKRNQTLADTHAQAKAALDRLGNTLIRPRFYDYSKNPVHLESNNPSIGKTRVSELEPERRAIRPLPAGPDFPSNASASVYRRGNLQNLQKAHRMTAPDFNARTSAIQKAQQQSARTSTPDLSQRLANMKAYAQPLRKTGLSGIADSAVAKGKSIVKGLTSLWKLGWK
jgi:hypothetical protein